MLTAADSTTQTIFPTDLKRNTECPRWNSGITIKTKIKKRLGFTKNEAKVREVVEKIAKPTISQRIGEFLANGTNVRYILEPTVSRIVSDSAIQGNVYSNHNANIDSRIKALEAQVRALQGRK